MGIMQQSSLWIHGATFKKYGPLNEAEEALAKFMAEDRVCRRASSSISQMGVEEQKLANVPSPAVSFLALTGLIIVFRLCLLPG